MSLPLTPDMLAAAYDFLRECPPFKAWKLPESDSVIFKVVRDRTLHGFHEKHRKHLQDGSEHCIAVSHACVGHTGTLMWVLAHEMIHLHQSIMRTETPGAGHNAEFHRFARLACKAHGWDAKAFS